MSSTPTIEQAIKQAIKPATKIGRYQTSQLLNHQAIKQTTYQDNKLRHYASIHGGCLGNSHCLCILRAFFHRRIIAYWTYPYLPLQYWRIDIDGGPAGVIHHVLLLLLLLLL